MTRVRLEPGSFRDPSGRIYYVDDRVFRTIKTYAAEDFEFVRGTGLLDRLADAGQVIRATPVSSDVLKDYGKDAEYVVEHPRLPFISYPYEWPFPALKAAALLQLDIQIEALASGITLSDASAYNIQFLGTQPLFIDILSFRRYREGEVWGGHRQFCEQFLNPLLLRAKLGVPHNAWYRGSVEGIGTTELRRLLRWTSKLSPNVLVHVVLQSALQRSSLSNRESKGTLATAKLPLASYRRMLSKLRLWIETLEPADTGKTVWQDYTRTHSYSDDEIVQKKSFIGKFVAATKPAILWDMGCNTGDYADTALRNGAGYCVGFDCDQGALELAFSRSATQNLRFLPLLLDGANPSPSQGWSERERLGLTGRAGADGIVALAFVHHIAIGRNVPLDEVVSWLTKLAPQGVIEFVPKQDPMVQELLAFREDIFPDYTEENFLGAIAKRSEIVETKTVTRSNRKLIWYRNRMTAKDDAR